MSGVAKIVIRETAAELKGFAGSRERCCAPRKTADSLLAQNPNSG
jgi:hypothetical protein